MDAPKRLADPDFEPTDEDLIGLSTRAFAHVPALERLHAMKMKTDLKAAG